tara:strand:- start:1741 stop:2136 length:396 start_codon:yes stop_codon:yes gene_type:complete
MDWKITDWDSISHLEKVAKSTKNTVKPSKNTVWWGLFDDKGQAQGCIGVLVLSGSKVRMKSHYVCVEHRNKGYGSEALKLAQDYCFKILGAKEIEIITRHYYYWRVRGYELVKERNKNKFVMNITKEKYDK